MQSTKTGDKMNEGGAGVLKDVVAGVTGAGNGVKVQAAVNGYYDSDGSDLGDDGEIRAKGPKRAGLPYPTQPGPPVYPAHYYPNPQTQNQGGHPQQPARGQPRPSTQAQQQPSAQRPQPTPGYGQAGQFAPGATQQQQQQQHRPHYPPPPPGGQSHVGYSHTGGNPQASAANRYPATTQGQPSVQKPAPKQK